MTTPGVRTVPIPLPRRNPVKGVRLAPVDLSATVWPSDLTEGQQWPPRRLAARTERMSTLWNVANTYLDQFVPGLEAPVNHYEPLLDYSTALLSDTPPEAAAADESSLIAAVGSMTDAMYTYGRALVIRLPDGRVMAPDMRFAYPLAGPGDNWVVTSPVAAPTDVGMAVNLLDLWVIVGSTMVGVRRQFRSTSTVEVSNGVLGPSVGTFDPVPVRVAHADRGRQPRGWGQSIIPALLPIIVEMNRREDGISYGLDRGERFILTANGNAHDLLPNAKRYGADVPSIGGADDPEVYRAVAQTFDDDIKIMSDGMSDLRFVKPETNVTGSFASLAYYSRLYTQLTGMAPVEASDGNDRTSGVAVARRQRALILKNRAIFNAQHRALRILFPDLEWQYVDDRLDAGIGELEGDQGRGQGNMTAAMEASA